MRGGRIELRGIRLLQSHHVARELNAGRLHSKTDSEVRNFLLASIADRDQHALDATLAEPARNQNSIVAFQLRCNALFVSPFQTLGLNPVELQLQVVSQRAM